MSHFLRDNFAYHKVFSPVSCDHELVVGLLADTIDGDADDTIKPASFCLINI